MLWIKQFYGGKLHPKYIYRKVFYIYERNRYLKNEGTCRAHVDGRIPNEAWGRRKDGRPRQGQKSSGTWKAWIPQHRKLKRRRIFKLTKIRTKRFQYNSKHMKNLFKRAVTYVSTKSSDNFKNVFLYLSIRSLNDSGH